MMMLSTRLKITIATALLILSTLGYATHLFFSIPDKIEQRIMAALNQSGFTDATFSRKQAYWNRVMFMNVKLDEDEFSTIKSIAVEYSTLSLMLGGTSRTITIKGLELTGELDTNNNITIAGWKKQNANIPKTLIKNTKTIILEKARINLLSEALGGISLSGDLQARPDKSGLSIQAILQGVQKQLSAQAKIEAIFENDGTWNIRSELEKGKLNLNHIRTSRLAGLLLANGTTQEDIRIIGELQAGGLNIAGLPWKNGSATIESDGANISMTLAAKSAGIEGIELALKMDDAFNTNAFEGNIYIDRIGSAFDYLNSQNALHMNRDDLKSLDPLTNVEIIFLKKNDLNFNIKQESKNIDIKGFLSLAGNSCKIKIASEAPLINTPDALDCSKEQTNGKIIYNDQSFTIPKNTAAFAKAIMQQ